MKLDYDEGEYRQYMGKAEFDKAINTLRGIIQGITIDSVITDSESEELANWVTLHEEFSNHKPFNEIIPMVKDALADGKVDQDEIEDIIWLCNQFDEGGKYYDLNTLSLQMLQGIFHGILADGVISDIEIVHLKDWINANDILSGTYPYDEINSIITSVLADGIITEEERGQLTAFIGEFIDCTKSYNISKLDLDALKSKYSVSGLCSINPSITIKDHHFCFTGKSSRASRSEIEEVVISRRGTFNNNVVKTTQFLIVGDEGNACWAFSCYGRKVEKAMQMRKEGKPIVIVHENDFWSVV